MSDGKKQKATKLPPNFCCSTCRKEMPRLAGLGNRCISTSCHSATMPVLAMHLIGDAIGTETAMANDAPAESLFQKSRGTFSLLTLFINCQKMVSNDANLWKTDFLPPTHCPVIFHTVSPLFSQMSPIFKCPGTLSPVMKFLGKTLVIFLYDTCILKA